MDYSFGIGYSCCCSTKH